MRIQIQLRIVSDDNSVISEDKILHLDKGDDRLEVLSDLGAAASYINQKDSLAYRRAIDVQRVAALRDLIFAI